MGISECVLCLFQMERIMDWIPVLFQISEEHNIPTAVNTAYGTLEQ